MRNRASIRFLSMLFLTWSAFLPLASAQRLVLSGGLVVDGTGMAPFPADVALEKEKILEIGTIAPASGDVLISVRGLVLAPGFIDLHSHSREGLLDQPEALTQISQGITTLVMGADGDSPYPCADYLRRILEKGIAVNVGLMVGHGTVRSIVMGDDYRREARTEEVHAMGALVKLAMRQGAFGLSSGLEYDPGFYSSTAEIVELARVASEMGGIYMSHIRDEEEGFRSALAEAIEIGKRAKIPVQISHLKLGNTRVWGNSSEVLQMIHQANREGISVRADCYPYNAWASSLSILVPSRRFENRTEVLDGLAKVGGPGKILITRYAPDPAFEFKTLEEIAAELGQEPADTFLEILRKGGADVVCESMNPEDVAAFYRDPLVMVASDGGTDSRHPRMSGTFPRVLREYVRERQLLTLEEAVRKMTSLPALSLGLMDRGTLRAGMKADLVAFDPDRVTDRSTFQQPGLSAEGIVMTIVNGKVVWRDGNSTGVLSGQALRRRPPKE